MWGCEGKTETEEESKTSLSVYPNVSDSPEWESETGGQTSRGKISTVSHPSGSHSIHCPISPLELPLTSVVDSMVEICIADKGNTSISKLRGDKSPESFKHRNLARFLMNLDYLNSTLFSLWITNQCKYKRRLSLIFSWNHTWQSKAQVFKALKILGLLDLVSWLPFVTCTKHIYSANMYWALHFQAPCQLPQCWHTHSVIGKN